MLIEKFNIVKDASIILENDIGVKLPLDYAKFLDKYNGGIVYNTTVKMGRKKDTLDGFYGVGNVKKSYGFNDLKTLNVFEEYLQKCLLPFASNEMGDDYCISLNSEDYGVIYLLHHDSLGKKKKVFSSFTEFIQSTSSEPIGYIESMEEREAAVIANGFGHKLDKLRPVWQKEIDKFSNLVQEEVILD